MGVPGRRRRPGEGEDEDAYRTCAARELEEEAGVRIDSADLVPYSRWITPEMAPTRFDTRFYIALAPAHSPPSRTARRRWTPAGSARRRPPAPPQRRDEARLPDDQAPGVPAASENPTAALEAAGQRPVEPILPKVVGEGDEQRVVLPGEPGY